MVDLPEIVFASSDPVQSRKIKAWLQDGLLRPLIPRAYTSNLQDDPSVIVRKNIWHLLATLFPDALISHRTALEYQISPQGNIYLTASARRVLAAALKSRTFAAYPEKSTTQEQFSHFAFFESYFSNYIEGTKFLVEEAIDIVYHDEVIPLRTADTHDIKGTYRICADRNEMQIIPSSAIDLIEILRRRHAIILGGRPEKNPGAFKSKANRAGESVFVEPQFVLGTLKMGFKIYDSLTDPISRALFMMFLISEVHPFADGNGRIARIMMNAELVRQRYTKIMIPTVFREDYLLALKRITRHHDPGVYIKTMLNALDFSHWLEPVSLDDLRAQLESANAFKEPEGNVLKWPQN